MDVIILQLPLDNHGKHSFKEAQNILLHMEGLGWADFTPWFIMMDMHVWMSYILHNTTVERARYWQGEGAFQWY